MAYSVGAYDASPGPSSGGGSSVGGLIGLLPGHVLVPFLLLSSCMIAHHRIQHPVRRTRQSGYSFVELVITVGMILVITTWAMPSFLNYYRSARVRAGAQAVSAYLNEARQQAIKTNSPVCATQGTATTFQLRTATGTTCLTGYVPVTGLTDSTGTVRLPDNITLSATTTIFGNLGNANTAGSYTVTDSVSGRTLHVTVAASGRVTIGP